MTKGYDNNHDEGMSGCGAFLDSTYIAFGFPPIESCPPPPSTVLEPYALSYSLSAALVEKLDQCAGPRRSGSPLGSQDQLEKRR